MGREGGDGSGAMGDVHEWREQRGTASVRTWCSSGTSDLTHIHVVVLVLAATEVPLTREQRLRVGPHVREDALKVSVVLADLALVEKASLLAHMTDLRDECATVRVGGVSGAGSGMSYEAEGKGAAASRESRGWALTSASASSSSSSSSSGGAASSSQPLAGRRIRLTPFSL